VSCEESGHSLLRFGIVEHGGELMREYAEEGDVSLALWDNQGRAAEYCRRHTKDCKCVVKVSISWEKVDK